MVCPAYFRSPIELYHMIEQVEAREFLMTDRDFETIKKLAMSWTGITLSDHKRNMIYGRLSRRLRLLSLKKFSDYCDLLNHDAQAERKLFINAITTNLTSFFRELHHFEFLENTLLAQIAERNRATRKLRIWSAGCSTGEEPHSIAMVVKSMPQLLGWDIKILATDLDTNVVQTADAGTYSLDQVDKIPKHFKKFFKPNGDSSSVIIDKEVRDLIRFKPLNLLEPWPMKNSFDIIFCRNVVIYFNLETQKTLFDRFSSVLCDNGHLFIGHSENLYKVTDRFKGIGRTIYQKQY